MKRLRTEWGGFLLALIACLSLADPARAQSTGTIQGTVTSNGSALPSAQVTIEGPQGLTKYTDSMGFYSMDVLVGNYRVGMWAPDGVVIAAVYVTVLAGQTATVNANFTPGTLAGTITENGVPLAGARVAVWTFNGGNPPQTTGPDGKYSFSLQSVTHYMVVTAPDGVVIGTGYPSVVSGQTTTRDFDLKRGTLSGTITENGVPLAGAHVVLWAFNEVGNSDATTGPMGTYSFSLQSVQDYIVVWAPDGVVIGTAYPIVVAGQVTTLNFDLRRATLKGLVIEGGVPVQGARVIAATKNVGNPPALSDSQGNYTMSLQSNIGVNEFTIARPNGTQLCWSSFITPSAGQVLNLVNCTPILNQAPTADAGPDQTLICSAPGGCPVLLDGSASTDPDSTAGTNDDITAFKWYEFFGAPNQTLLGIGEQITVNLSVGVHTIMLEVTDSGGLTDTDEVVVTENSPASATQELINAVQGLGLPQGAETSLTSKLNNAIASLNQGNTTAAENKLNAFINEVNALVNSGKLTSVQASALIAAAQEIIDAI